MKVKQLIKLLSKEDPEAEIILASDAEGNSFHYFDDSLHSGEFAYQVDGDIEICDEFELDDVDKSLKPKPCVILFPN